jgi:hypothetical protein
MIESEVRVCASDRDFDFLSAPWSCAAVRSMAGLTRHGLPPPPLFLQDEVGRVRGPVSSGSWPASSWIARARRHAFASCEQNVCRRMRTPGLVRAVWTEWTCREADHLLETTSLKSLATHPLKSSRGGLSSYR